MSVAVVAMTKPILSSENGTINVPDFDWNSSEKSIILSSFYYGYVPIQVFIGMLLKYISPHIVFGIGTAVPGLFTILTPLIATYLPLWVLVTTRVVMGLMQGVAVPCLMKFWTIWGVLSPIQMLTVHFTFSIYSTSVRKGKIARNRSVRSIRWNRCWTAIVWIIS